MPREIINNGDNEKIIPYYCNCWWTFFWHHQPPFSLPPTIVLILTHFPTLRNVVDISYHNPTNTMWFACSTYKILMCAHVMAISFLEMSFKKNIGWLICPRYTMLKWNSNKYNAWSNSNTKWPNNNILPKLCHELVNFFSLPKMIYSSKFQLL